MDLGKHRASGSGRTCRTRELGSSCRRTVCISTRTDPGRRRSAAFRCARTRP